MAYISVLKEVEDFLRTDLANEKLSTKARNKKNSVLTKVSSAINHANELEKVDKFLAEQRELSRVESLENGKAKTLSDEDDGDYYMDLTDIGDGPTVAPRMDNKLVPPAMDDGGSGSGYESYNSDEESATRPKKDKDEDLTAYFVNAGCDIFTYIYFENKGNFLTGKKWVKRIGIVKENHLKCFKKPSDTAAVLDIPLRAYNATLKIKEGTTSTIIVLSAGSEGDAHRFYVERDKSEEWAKVLKEKTSGVTDTRGAPAPPPVAARPSNTLPRAQTQENFGSAKPQYTGVQRSPSIGVGDIGKGLKSAVTDMFKKDKVKKRMSTAENLGAAVCGYLLVYDKNWVKKWCLVKNNQLLIYGKEEAPELQVDLQGCDLLPYSDDPERQFGFKILKNGKEVVYMEAGSSDEMGKWVGVLIAETGLAEIKMSEPDYMSIEMRKSVMSSAKQAFKSRKDTISRKKTGNSIFFKEEEIEEDLYIDFTTEVPDNALPSPPTTEPSTEKDKDKNKKTKKAPKQANDSKPQSADKKEKQKDKKKEKHTRQQSNPPSLIDAKPNRIEGAKTLAAKSTTLPSTESKVEARKKEISSQKADIKTRLLTLRVKKDELNKYIDASKTEKERGRLRVMLQKVTEEHSALEKEDIALELEQRKLKDGAADIESPSNKRPPPRQERKPIQTGATGNVLSKAQMWESGKTKSTFHI